MSDAKFIHDENVYNVNSARIILPLIFRIIKPNSVLDIGCGIGTWIKVFEDLGIKDLLGIDGAYVENEKLKIDSSKFLQYDLNSSLNLGRKFDLCLCLEVAEHIHSVNSDDLIKSITSHADVVLFSAAIPGQGGQYHINEQWPSYWQEKFNSRNYEMIDYFRPLIWDNHNIEYWYRQNLFLVINREHELYNTLEKRQPLSLVHPELLKLVIDNYQKKIQRLNNSISRLSARDLLGKISRIFR